MTSRALRREGRLTFLAIALAAVSACAPDAPIGYWIDDRSPPAAAGRDAAGAEGTAPVSGAAGTGADAGGQAGASAADAAAAAPDASMLGDAWVGSPAADAGAVDTTDGGVCDLGGGVTLPEEITIGVVETVYFADGARLPAGRYRVSYVDGCRKFNEFGAWTVHGTSQSLTRATSYTIVAGSEPLLTAPGTVGLFAGPGPEPYGGFATYDECVAANRAVPPVDFDFAGGALGVMDGGDGTSSDDVPGEMEGGRNPTFELTRLDACP